MISRICDIFSPSGSEEKMREYIIENISSKFDSVKSDNFGNIVARSGNGSLCIECGMDSCGIMIVSIDEGTAHFAGVGGINAEYLIGKKILFCDDNIGIVRYDGKTPAESKFSDLYIECDSGNRQIGDFGVVASEYCRSTDKIFAHGLGNRLGISVVLDALRQFDRIDNLCILFSAQKRLGARGIQAFFSANEFDRVLTVDAIDGKKNKDAAFVVADLSGVCGQDFKGELSKFDLGFAVTDENLCIANISATGKGARCCGLGIPVGCKSNSFESVKNSDIQKATDALMNIILENQR